MKYSLSKINIVQIVFFVCEWFLATLNSGYYFTERIKYIEDFSRHFMHSSAGYTALQGNVGIVMTAFYCIMLHQFIRNVGIRDIISYGRDKFVFHDIKSITKFTFLFVFEFWIVNIILCMVFCDFSLLLETQFFLCNILFFVTLFLYFIIVGFTMLLLRYVLCFKKGYMLITIAFFFFLTIINFYIALTPVFYSSFIYDWFRNNAFDALDYCINIGKAIIIIAILIAANRLVFSRKDIILNEEQD